LQLGLKFINKNSAPKRSAGESSPLEPADFEEFFWGGQQGSPGVGGAAIPPKVHVQDFPGVNAREVSSSTGPCVLLRILDEAGSHGIPLDVAKGDGEMIAVERAGVEAVLPEVTGASATSVQVVGVAAVSPAKCDSEGVRLIRHGHDVYMIRHEAIGEYPKARATCGRAEQVEINGAVGIGEEDGFAIRSPLGDVMREADRDRSG